jgi:hypothetical protein
VSITPKYSRKVKALKRLCCARVDFESAAEAARALLKTRGMTKPARMALQCGMIVKYARPFGANNGLGSLPDDPFAHFSDSRLQRFHERVLDSRNKMEAHNDILLRGELLESRCQKRKTSLKIEIVLAKKGIDWLIETHSLDSNVLKSFLRLIETQASRVENAINKLLIELCFIKPRRMGKYTLGVGFP